MYVKLRNVNAVRAKGRTYYYHRKTGERLPDDPDARAKRVLEINAGLSEKSCLPSGGSMAALIAAYKASPDFQEKAEKTRREYTRQLKWFEDHYATAMVTDLDSEWVWELRDAFADTPREANYKIQVLSLLCSHALRRPRQFGLMRNPCEGVKKFRPGKGIPAWPDNVIKAALDAAYPELRWTIVTGLYLGQRAGDDIKLTWSHDDGHSIQVAQSKTGKRLKVPAHPTLRAALDAIPKRGVVMLTTPKGGAWKVDHLRHEYTRLMRQIGFPGYSRHGLRKNAVNRLLEAGCTTAQVAAVTGQTMQMVEHYAAQVNQARLADEAIRKLIENESSR
jgi:integrase